MTASPKPVSLVSSESEALTQTPSTQAPLMRRIAQCLKTANDVDAVSDSVMAVLTETFQVDRGSFFLIDPATMSLRSHVAGGMDKALVVPLRVGVIGAAILQRRSLRVDEAYAHPFFDPDTDNSLNFRTRTLLVAPMISSSGKVLGGIEMLNKDSGVFSVDDEAQTVAAAARVARWIEEDSIYPAGIEAEAIAMRRALNCERTSIFSFDDRSSRLIALYADGDDGRLLSLNVKLGIAGMVAITGNSIMLKDAWEDGRFDRSVDARTGYRTRSMLCVALRAEAGPSLGVIQLINRSSGPFSQAHLQQLESVAAMIAPTVRQLVSRNGTAPLPFSDASGAAA